MDDLENLQAARKLFGEMAVQKGYCSRESLERAMQIQDEMEEQNHSHKMLGLVMLQEGIIDNAQFIELLKELDHIVHDDP